MEKMGDICRMYGSKFWRDILFLIMSCCPIIYCLWMSSHCVTVCLMPWKYFCFPHFSNTFQQWSGWTLLMFCSFASLWYTVWYTCPLVMAWNQENVKSYENRWHLFRVEVTLGEDRCVFHMSLIGSFWSWTHMPNYKSVFILYGVRLF